MHKLTALLPLALLTLAAFPAAAQEVPRMLFCMGQCFGVQENGARIPVTKGTALAPGLRLETGPDSYAQVKLGQHTVCGIGESARVRFDQRARDRDVVILDQGRIRVIGGDAIGRPGTRAVELHTIDGNFVLRSADIEVKTLPKTGDALAAPTLVKLNIGEARLGDVLLTRDAVQGIVGGKILDRAIPIGDIALAPHREAAPGGGAGQTVRPPLTTLPVINLPVTEFRTFTPPTTLSPAIVSPEFSRTTQLTSGQAVSGSDYMSQALVFPSVTSTLVAKAPDVTASTLILAQPVVTTTGTTSLNNVATTIQRAPATPTVLAPLTQTFTMQPTFTTPANTPVQLSPQFTRR